MLRWAGVGVAMGNAPAEVKQAVRYVTAANADDGVALAIERFLLVAGAQAGVNESGPASLEYEAALRAILASHDWQALRDFSREHNAIPDDIYEKDEHFWEVLLHKLICNRLDLLALHEESRAWLAQRGYTTDLGGYYARARRCVRARSGIPRRRAALCASPEPATAGAVWDALVGVARARRARALDALRAQRRLADGRARSRTATSSRCCRRSAAAEATR